MARKPHSTQTDLAVALRARRVLTLDAIRQVLGDVSIATAFRRLARITYRSSYNFNGRYYSLHEEAKYDRYGLWAYEKIRFSRDGNLTATVRRLVRESVSGYTQRELQQLLGVRVQNVAAALLKRSELARERIGETFVYLHSSRAAFRQQSKQRRQRPAEELLGEQQVALDVVVDILMVLIRHPGSDPATVSRRLRKRSPPIGIEQIKWVFRRYQLGEKRGLSKS